MQIREDTIRDGSDYTLLNLTNDYITTFAFDSSLNKTMAQRWQDSTGTGNVTLTTTSADYKGAVPIEKTNAIWRAGFDLWWTLPSERTLWTPNANKTNLIPFDTTDSSTLAPYLGQSAVPDGMQTINYVLGYDCAIPTTGVSCDCATVGQTGSTCAQIGRSRTVQTGACSTRKSPCDGDTDCPTGETCISDKQVWKMGDIISSTPRIMGPGPLNNYHIPAPSGYNDATYAQFIKSNDYANRQTVFVGSNDGMLHAFRLGKMLQKWTTPTNRTFNQIVKQEGTTGTGGIGTERYGFIPQNALPYLQYLRDPNYCHLYLVDGPTTLTDVSISKPSACTQSDYANCVKSTTMLTQKVCSATTSTTCSIDTDCPSSEQCVEAIDTNNTSWRTVLIGSMGLGGGSCQITPPLAAPYSSVGQSSYFALDVTDQANPKLLWEFTDPALGTTNVGASIVKVGGVQKRCTNDDTQTCSSAGDCGSTTASCATTNGKWYAILASGPTGPITGQAFQGTSTQNLKIFVLDLKTGTTVRSIDTGIPKAFAGSISNSVVDLDKANIGSSGNYQDDAMYIGYVQDTSTTTGNTTVTSSGGGVLRLVINNNTDPSQWSVSKVIDGIGPVTASVANLLDRVNGKLWLYFGEGRYFFKTDDNIDSRHLYGIPEPCFQNNTILASCSSTVAFSSLQNQTTISSVTTTAASNALNASQHGWYITLPTATSNGPERVISNPTPDPNGAVFFLTFAPTTDICSFGGTTYLWALDYKTAGTVTYIMQGKALVQVSTGEIKELNLADAFSAESNRKTPGFMGIPPAGQGVMIITNPTPLKKFMHVQEK